MLSGSVLSTGHSRNQRGRQRELERCPKTGAALTNSTRQLLCSPRKCRQFFDVAGVMLDDDLGLEVVRDLLDALHRSDRLRAVVVERGHAKRIVVLAEVHRITA